MGWAQARPWPTTVRRERWKNWSALRSVGFACRRSPVVIEGLRRILDGPEFEVVNAVADGRALVRAAVESQADIIVTGVAMPLLNGIEAARQIRQQNPKARIIFLTMHTGTNLCRRGTGRRGLRHTC